jgi:polyhydroxyalkanoate synthase subunit PhaC
MSQPGNLPPHEAPSPSPGDSDPPAVSEHRPATEGIPTFAPQPSRPRFQRPPPGHYSAQAFDRAWKAGIARLTQGISPAGLASVFTDWALHLALSPGKQFELVEKAWRKQARFSLHAWQQLLDPAVGPCIEPLPQDHRFDGQAWKQWPWNLVSRAFLLQQQWWHNATTEVDGVAREDERVVSFVVRQMLDRFAPANFIATNPEVLAATLAQGGMNLLHGSINLFEDTQRRLAGRPPVEAERFRVGIDVACTPGEVVYRNHLIELIQYRPTTASVHATPVLVVPAWIMKYYILDLSPGNSLVRHLVAQGHTVFMISWRNPTSEDRDLGLDDYHRLGVRAALDAIAEIVPGQAVHGVGYCLGGTLLAATAAALARDGSGRLASLTLLASETDFSEAGELTLFIRESEVAFLESLMWDQGFLDGYQMAGAFQLLRSNDLVWSRLVREYLLGERQCMTDLMAWNADLTRMPYRMHSEYLRELFLENRLAAGRYLVDGRPVSLADLHLPVFAVGTEGDHVAPWRSVYKVTFLPAAEVTFVLTSGGHNAGIVSEPGHPGRRFRIGTRRVGERFIDPDAWMSAQPVRGGSWWPAWQAWLAEHSGPRQRPPTMGATGQGLAPLGPAPGEFVHQE